MSKTSEQAAALLKHLPTQHPIPAPIEGASLLAHGALYLLHRELTPTRAVAGIRALLKNYEDWNELRVSQAQEIAANFAPRGSSAPARLAKYVPAARALKAYLQEVFQKTHGLDLEWLREENAPEKALEPPETLGGGGMSYLLALAKPEELPILPSVARMMDRLGLIARTGSTRKAREAIAPFVPEDGALAFAVALGEVAEKYCDSRKPTCWECPLCEICPYGKKVHKDWVAQQVRLEKQRQREEAQRLAREQREREKQERERKRREAAIQREARRKTREMEKTRRAEERRRAAEARKAEATRKREAAAKQRAEQAKRSAEAKAKAQAAKKKSTAKKKTASTKKAATATKTTTQRKTAAKKKSSANKAAVAKKTSARRATTRRRSAGTRKTTTRRR